MSLNHQAEGFEHIMVSNCKQANTHFPAHCCRNLILITNQFKVTFSTQSNANMWHLILFNPCIQLIKHLQLLTLWQDFWRLTAELRHKANRHSPFNCSYLITVSALNNLLTCYFASFCKIATSANKSFKNLQNKRNKKIITKDNKVFWLQHNLMACCDSINHFFMRATYSYSKITCLLVQTFWRSKLCIKFH